MVPAWVRERWARRDLALTLADYERRTQEIVSDVVAEAVSKDGGLLGHAFVAFLSDYVGERGPWAWVTVVADNIGQYKIRRGSAGTADVAVAETGAALLDLAASPWH
jgi:hypothetical protein